MIATALQHRATEAKGDANPPITRLERVVDNRLVIPLVKVREPSEVWGFWKHIPVRRIAVDYISLQRVPSIYHRATSSGIHSAMEFDGEITAVCVGRDWDLDRLDVPRYAADAESMGFDLVMTPDDYTYLSDPPNYRMQRILAGLAKAREVMAAVHSADVVGTVKGTVCSEIEFNVERLTGEGVKTLAFPCSEFMELRRFTEPQYFVRSCKEKGAKPWIVGANSLSGMQRLGPQRYSASGWCYAALSEMIYGERSWKRVGTRFWCGHDACKLDQDAYPPYVARALHNIRRLLEEGQRLESRGEYGEL